jgi:hypothetical protein
MSTIDSNVIEFPFGTSRKEFARKSRASKKAAPEQAPKPAAELSSESVGNGRLRLERREAFRAAEAATRYWRVRLDLETAISLAQSHDISEGRLHPAIDRDNWMPMVTNYREALVRQLLTPAWDANSVTWKQTTFAKGQHEHTDVNPKKIERAIADDQAWIAAHPTRRSKSSEAMARSREFKIAMRQRIKEIAASRDLSDEAIRPVLKLKHEEIGRFCQTHGVNIGWLLEGAAPMFKAWPTS